MLFSGGLIPTYLVVHDLGLLNTRWAIVLPGAMSVWNMIITRTYFQVTIPNELHEAAKIDGCDDFRFFARIVLPLSKPIIAVNLLFVAVGQWNQFFSALIYLTDESLFPLQLVLREILIQNRIDPQSDGRGRSAASAGAAGPAEVLPHRGGDGASAAGSIRSSRSTSSKAS